MNAATDFLAWMDDSGTARRLDIDDGGLSKAVVGSVASWS